LGPLLDSLIEALGGEQAWGAQVTDSPVTPTSAETPAADDPPF
jgi:hypothetical protein